MYSILPDKGPPLTEQEVDSPLMREIVNYRSCPISQSWKRTRIMMLMRCPWDVPFPSVELVDNIECL